MNLRGSLLAATVAVGSWLNMCGALAVTMPVAGETMSAETMASAEREFLAKAIAQTPYSALVVHTRVDIAPIHNKSAHPEAADAVTEERHIYHARVLETFRGKPASTIRYEMVVERGEGAEIDAKPQILTLCLGPRGLYWPGTGASFDAVQSSVMLARRVARETSSLPSRGYSQCN